MSLSFRKAGARGQWWGGPLVRAGRPRPALSSKNQVLAKIEGPARGPAADQGVRPTNYASVHSGKLSDIGLSRFAAIGSALRLRFGGAIAIRSVWADDLDSNFTTASTGLLYLGVLGRNGPLYQFAALFCATAAPQPSATQRLMSTKTFLHDSDQYT